MWLQADRTWVWLIVFMAILVLAVAADLPAISGPASEERTRKDSLAPRVDSLFSSYSDLTPGCALGVMRNGAFVYKRGYGMANLEHGVPITTQTVFDIASVSKQFTAASLLLLEQQGKLTLEDDLRNYVTELPDYGTPITLRQLLHHTSGLRDYIELLQLTGSQEEEVTTEADALAMLVRQKGLNFTPGWEHLYSNSGYLLLSLVVKRASGLSLREFAQENLFAPLGMNSTQYLDDHSRIVPRRATAYAPSREGAFRMQMSNWEQTGDGAVLTTVEDLARWDRNFDVPEVGGWALVEKLLLPGVLASGEKLTYALGLVVDRYRGLKRVHHGGSWAGYRAHFMRFPDQRFSVLLLCNLATANPGKLAEQVADVYLADELQQAEASPGEPPSETTSQALSGAELARYAGVYWEEKTESLRRVTLQEGKLMLSAPGRDQPVELLPLGNHEFRLADSPLVRLRFRGVGLEGRLELEEVAETGRVARYTAMPRAEFASGELAMFEGSYHSEEFDVTWAVELRENRLLLRRRRQSDTALEPAFGDTFTAGPVLLRFVREPAGRPTGFLLSVRRIRQLKFVLRGR